VANPFRTNEAAITKRISKTQRRGDIIFMVFRRSVSLP